MKRNSFYDIIIIGGGASGLMCAASLKMRVSERALILDAGRRPGTKLLMTGNGRCNLTHSGSVKDFTSCYGEAGRRIRKLLYRHSNDDMADFFAELGIRLEEETDGRVFPESRRAADVASALISRAEANGWRILSDTRVTDILPPDIGEETVDGPPSDNPSSEKLPGYKLKVSGPDGRNDFSCRYLVLAPGGITYPGTGSDGSVHRILRRRFADVDMTELKPALAPISVDSYPYSELAGLTLEHAKITMRGHGVKESRFEGGLLFAHGEFTGPAVLAASAKIYEADEISISYMPEVFMEEGELRGMLDRLFAGSGDALASRLSAELSLPKRLIKALLERSGLSPKRFLSILTADTFRLSGKEPPLSRAMITRGGIPVSKVRGANPATLELDGYPNCFAIGELLDVDGKTGGYNLQFAYSSARAAADAIDIRMQEILG